MGDIMKKASIVFLTLVATGLLTLILFDTMSWYHIGDIPTKVVLIRLIGFFCVISGIALSTIALIIKKKKH